MSDYQLMILEGLQIGARLQSTEGVNYKCWLVYQNGERRNVRRDSAERVCQDNERYLVFGEHEGIRWRNV
jgi:hypothetical protein